MLQRIRMLSILVAGLAGVSGAASAVTIPVSADASVFSSNPNGNYGTSTHEGGLFTGETSGVTRFFLKFELPALVLGTYVSSAILTGTYTFDLFGATDAEHGIFLVPIDSWQEDGPTGLTWNNQPVSGGLPLATWDAALAPPPPVAQSFDLTSAVNLEYQGDGVLSLMFRALDEGQTHTWEYWSSREHTDQPGFSLDLVITPVPEPGTGALLALGVAALAGCRQTPTARAGRSV